jgi:hypothetical protein
MMFLIKPPKIKSINKPSLNENKEIHGEPLDELIN